MLVRLWMAHPPISTPPTTPIPEVALEMARRRIRRILIVEPGEGRRLLGIVSLHDVARAFPPDVNPLSVGDWRGVPRDPVADIMTRDPVTTTADASIDQAAAAMLRHKIGALPVVRGTTAIGLITESDVFRALVALAGEKRGVGVTFDVAEGEDACQSIAAAAARHHLEIVSFHSMRHEGRRLASVRIVGAAGEALVDELWRSGHRVVSVEHLEAEP
jgi:acetoin utilization protein AcuB